MRTLVKTSSLIMGCNGPWEQNAEALVNPQVAKAASGKSAGAVTNKKSQCANDVVDSVQVLPAGVSQEFDDKLGDVKKGLNRRRKRASPRRHVSWHPQGPGEWGIR